MKFAKKIRYFYTVTGSKRIENLKHNLYTIFTKENNFYTNQNKFNTFFGALVVGTFMSVRLNVYNCKLCLVELRGLFGLRCSNTTWQRQYTYFFTCLNQMYVNSKKKK